MSNIKSLKTLESNFKNKLTKFGGKLDGNDEVQRLKLEVERLHEENASLIKSQTQIEKDLNRRIDDLDHALFEKKNELDDEKQSHRDLIRSLNKNRQEEIKSWTKRQDALKRTVAELRHQAEDTRNRRDAALLMKDEEHRLQ